MKQNSFVNFIELKHKYMIICMLIVSTCSSIVLAPHLWRGKLQARNINISDFEIALAKGNDSESLQIGDLLFSRLSKNYKSQTGLSVLKAKLQTAEFLAERMITELQQAAENRLLALAEEVFDDKKNAAGDNNLTLAPAKMFYETSRKVFSKPIRIDELTKQADLGHLTMEKEFLTKYYDLKLRILTSSIARAGQGLAIAEPTFEGTHNYILVLPLLHASETKPINISVLPRWMQKPESLQMFSNSCLLYFGLPFHAMTFAKEAAKAFEELFSEEEFYRGAAKMCGTSHIDVAADCLHRAFECVPAKEADRLVQIKFDMVQLWLDSENYMLAAGQARQIYKTFPQHPRAGKAIWLHYFALSRANDADAILMDIDRALADQRCQQYKPKIMYTKWWALRRKRNTTAQIAALEHELLKEYGDDPMVAPVLLSRATDMLAKQDYGKAYQILNHLQEKFPSIRTADQAKEMMDKLQSTKAAGTAY